MLTKKRTSAAPPAPHMLNRLASTVGGAVDRRTFLRRSGIAAGGAALGAVLPAGTVRRAQAAETAQTAGGEVEMRRTICTHCSVGCTVEAEVSNGVWIGQEPGYDSPFNLGAHCAKGASVREHAHGERRLKHP